MNKTFITKMPDKAGAFLKASDVISKHGGNIIRVSYNKAVDRHALFIDVSASEKQISAITSDLSDMGYLLETKEKDKVILVVFKLRDVPGAVKPVLEILNNYKINISYISSQENGTEYQYFKMGLLIEDPNIIKGLLDEVSKICEVRILDYDASEKVLDNTVFYLGFANEIRTMLNLTQEQTNEFIVNSNKIMQMLDERNEPPFKIFEMIRKFAKFLIEYEGENFKPIISKRKVSEKVMLHLIQPPCGSNTYILESPDELLFVDSGFECYKEEMLRILKEMFPNFTNRKKRIILTHADIDHCGLLSIFDEIYINKTCYQNFLFESRGEPNYREQNALNEPHFKLSRIISGYHTPEISKLKVINTILPDLDKPLTDIGVFKFEDLEFQLFEGNGGHVPGEMIMLCKDKQIIFTGDNFVNIGGFSASQAEFNLLSPYLMTSVNMDSKKATAIRKKILQMVKSHNCVACPGHGDFYTP